MKKTAAAALLALALAACGGSNGKTTTTAAPMTTVSAVAQQLTSHGISVANLDTGTTEYFARESGSATIEGEDGDIATFATTGNRDQWLQVAKNAGGVYVVGPTWVVQVNSEAVANKVRGAIGGDIQ